ncbi:MAG TPA: Do family serine endopeptidase [Candidatus Sulfotelmatobacter sp.]|jgi:serine protease Do|nr:Do family serine endopeptidase [Candidatus Sulfotelmatobacter sp.]
MKSWIKYCQAALNRRLLIALAAVATVLSLTAYEFDNPVRAAAPAAAAAPLDDNSVSALLSLDRAMETLAARVTPAIVNVTVVSKKSGIAANPTDSGDNDGDNNSEGLQQFFKRFGPQFGQQFGFGPHGFGQMGPQSNIEHGLGSGVIISPDGYIVTNNHVIDGAVDIRVTLTDRRILPAKLVGADPLTDLAVIKIDGSNLPSVPLGDSTQLHPGQTVLAFGNPLGFRFTVTRGIVSALNRPNPSADRRSPGEFIQTDAAINPGNSGGPLVNAHGEVVGINTFLVSETGGFSGMGFAIPAQIVKPTVDNLIKYGKVSHGYIGIGISDVTPDEAHFFHVNNASGAVITQVEPNSPGAKAGLKVGDVITELDGKPVTDAGALQVEVGEQRPGATLHLKALRDGNSVDVPVTLEAMGKGEHDNQSSDASHGKPRWGVGLGDLTPDLRQQLQAGDDVNGAVIEQVTPGSPADNAGLQQGEVITEVNRQPVHSAADVQRALASVPKDSDALVLVWSNAGSTFRVLHPTRG